MKNAKELLNSKEYLGVVQTFKNLDFTDRTTYGAWLAQTYYFVCHSVRLSSLGAAWCQVDDPLGKRMLAHTREEHGHHTIALKDLNSLGFNIQDFPEYGLTKAFYQSQYYKVMVENPAHLLGQIIVLEAIAVEIGSWMYDVVYKAFGEKSSVFVKVHAQEDKDHVIKAMSAIDQMTESQKKGVTENFMQACEMYCYILEKIGRHSSKRAAA